MARYSKKRIIDTINKTPGNKKTKQRLIEIFDKKHNELDENEKMLKSLTLKQVEVKKQLADTIKDYHERGITLPKNLLQKSLKHTGVEDIEQLYKLYK